jgi:hypothetical protein
MASSGSTSQLGSSQGSRKDQYATRVSVDGVNLGTFDTLTGGEVDTDELKYKPGGMAPQVSLGGLITIGQVVVTRLYQLQRDHLSVHWLISRVGKGVVVINKQPLDPDGNAFGKPLVYRGTLKRVLPPEVDSNATDAAMIEIELTPEGSVA